MENLSANCKNCGAPVDVLRSSCHYCHTYYFERPSTVLKKDVVASYMPRQIACSGTLSIDFTRVNLTQTEINPYRGCGSG